ncbi:MAG: Ig-like domain-containing protein [Calditrichaeota bacterium]|nr:Ig-like domain-containing protein [Calditrichota bacterium]
MQSGNIRFSVHHANYADIWYYANIDPSGNHQNGTIYNFDMPVKLFKNDQSIESTLIYYTNGVANNAAGVTVFCDILSFPNDQSDELRGTRSVFQKEDFVITSDQDGKIHLTNLPDFEIRLEAYTQIDEDRYAAYTSSYLRPLEYRKMLTFSIYEISEFLNVISSNVTDDNGDQIRDFDETANIVVAFDKDVDIVNPNTQIRLNVLSGAQVAINYQWLDNNRTLVINPVNDLSANTNYYVYLTSLSAVTGERLNSASLYFKTAE